MNIGDTVIVTGEYCRFKRGTKRLIQHMVTKATKAIYLGKTTLHEGTVLYGHGGDEPDSFMTENLVRVLVLQPLHATGQRYRKPFYAALEDVETNEQ